VSDPDNRSTKFSFLPDSTLFWSSNKPSTIYSSNGAEDTIFLSADLRKAHQFRIFESHLYFVNTPQFGPQKKLERVSLTNSSQRNVMINFEHLSQVPTGFTFDCQFLYWTDAISSALWRMPLSSPPMSQSRESGGPATQIYTSTQRNRHFNVVFPHAVTSRRNLDQPSCIPNSGDNPSTTAAAILDSTPQKSTEASVVHPSTSTASLIGSSENSIIPSTTDHPVPTSPKILSSSLAPSPSPSPLRGDVKLCGEDESETACFNGATCLYLEENLFCL